MLKILFHFKLFHLKLLRIILLNIIHQIIENTIVQYHYYNSIWHKLVLLTITYYYLL